MITENREVEALVEKFGEALSQEYSKNTDRSAIIIDYVMGRTEQFPDLLPDSMQYAYRSMDLFEKLAKKDDSDVFFRAGALMLRMGLNASRSYYWQGYSLAICLGDGHYALGLAGKSKAGSQRLQSLLPRMEKIHKFAGDKAIMDELKSRVSKCNFGKKDAGDTGVIINTLLLLKLYSLLDHTSTHQFNSQRLASEFPEILQAVLAENTEQLRELLNAAVKPIIAYPFKAKENYSVRELNADFITSQREKTIAAHYPDLQAQETGEVSRIEFNRTLTQIHSALLYVINVKGGKQLFLDEPGDVGLALLDAVRTLHEVYPLEVRQHLLALDRRAKKPDELLEGIVPFQEPYELIERLSGELNSYMVPWSALQSYVLSVPDQALRAYEILRSAYYKAYLHKVLTDGGIALSDEAGTLTQAVFAVLRGQSEGGRHGLFLARYLEGETSFEDYWKDETNRSLFDPRNRDSKRKSLLVAVSFLPPDSPYIRRLAILITRPECDALTLVSEMYHSYSFSGQKLLELYGEDPEVSRERLLSGLLMLNGMRDYYYRSMPQSEYRSIIRNNLTDSLKQYKNLPTDSRLTVLEIAFEDRDALTLEQLTEAIRAGLLDSSKKASGAALAEFSRVPDETLYLTLYRTEKKAAIKELVLNSLRSVTGSKAAYQQLLETEKSEDWRTLIQILLDTADLSPVHAHAALADQADAKKTARLSWLSVNDLPALLDLEGQQIDDRIKSYLMLQSMDHTTAPNERLNELRSYVNSDSLSNFAAELIQLWIQSEAPAKEKWVLYVGALFGDRRLIQILAPQIKEWTENSRGAMAAEAVKALSYLSEPAALMAIDKIKRTVKNRQVKGAAEEALQLAAENQGLTPEQLEDRLVTSLGFDDKGAQQFSYGERTFQVKVNRSLEVIVINEETGKPLKSLPAPGQKDDAELAAKAKADFNLLKKDLKTMVGIQAQRLEESLSKQRLWSAEEWTALFVGNIVMQKFAVGLIWGMYEQGSLTDTFRYMEDGTFNTVDEDEYELADGAKVGLVHPLELDQEALEGWKSQLDDYEIKQPFEQLNRQIHLVEEENQQSTVYEDLPRSELSPTAFPKALEKYGWYKGSAQDGGWYSELYKDYGDWLAELRFSGTSITYYEGLEDITLELLQFHANEKGQYSYYSDIPALALGKIPGRVFSETIYDILRASGR
ncbi:DUF4132 domain-containing protein [Paenibacillus sp. Leaf72]|uniref:DUF4132 domain-containing protein n=1 Tax=Paenibacillus sp. Leaf72 TaxID=1736234 RepID=UPI0006FCA660|nr:DUF4132 domain-containing protein [Paenibacillus sp. Leaf72]KQO18165.1 hypothetical protein ASF12_05870 [Paenibacillus sp. Leaf72]